MKWKQGFFLLFIFIAVTACSSLEAVEIDGLSSDSAASEAPIATEDSFDSNQAANLAYSEADFDSELGGESAIAPEQQGESHPQKRLIIRTANLRLVVGDTDDALDAITEMVESNGGWVVSSDIYQYSDSKQGTITVRIPSTGFNSALDAMKGLAVEVTNESVSGQDVTEEFVDLSLRLENLEATADRVRSFLEDATKVEDALAVNQELSRLEGEIELLKGRREFLSQSAQFSTITIELTPDELNQPIEVAGWRPQGIAKEAIEALIDALQGTGSFLIWFTIYVLPIGLLYGVPIYFVGRWINRWRKRRRDARLAQTAVSEAE